jgi:uncharacterized protein YcnI
MTRSQAFAALALGAGLLAFPSLAHVTLDQSSLPADSYVRVVLRVPHGCDGAATTGVRLQVPTELRQVKPMAAAGWTLTIVPGEPAANPGGHGASPLPREIAWLGGNLPDNQFQEFVMRVQTPAAPGGTIHFPVVQECEGGKVSRWIERAVAGAPEPRYPAHAVRIVPKN